MEGVRPGRRGLRRRGAERRGAALIREVGAGAAGDLEAAPLGDFAYFVVREGFSSGRSKSATPLTLVPKSLHCCLSRGEQTHYHVRRTRRPERQTPNPPR